MIQWEDGQTTSEPLDEFAKTNPVPCAIYARDNGLLETKGWIRFKRIANSEKKFLRMVKQAHLQSYHSAPKFKYGVEIPKNYEDAMRLD